MAGTWLQSWGSWEAILHPLSSRESCLVRKMNKRALQREAAMSRRHSQDSCWPFEPWDQFFWSLAVFWAWILWDTPVSSSHKPPFLAYIKSNWFLLITKRVLINKSLWSDLIIHISSWQEVGTVNYSVYWLLRQKKVKRYKMQKTVKSFMRLITRPHA